MALEPVIAGLAVGIIFVSVLSVLMTPTSQDSFNSVTHAKVDSLIIASTNKISEAQVFFSEYPDGKVEVDRTGDQIDGSAIKYSFEKVYDDGKVNEFAMFVMIDDAVGKPTGQIYTTCGTWYIGGFGGMSTVGIDPDTTRTLQMTDCAK